jgi:hypothetical protein
MDNYIEVQWGLYIEHMGETQDYNITLILLTIIPLAIPRKHGGGHKSWPPKYEATVRTQSTSTSFVFLICQYG